MKKIQWKQRLFGFVLLGILSLFGPNTFGAENGLNSVQEESSILPIGDGTGALLLKSDGYYCLKENGTLETTAAVHYFDHVVMGDVVFHGFYYHDASGKFAAANPHIVALSNVRITVDGEKFNFDGNYMVNNLGRLSAAPQIRYIDQLVLNNVTYDGFFYFNEYGRMVTSPGIYEVYNAANGRVFEGMYYFGGPNGALVTEAGETPDGVVYDESGRLVEFQFDFSEITDEMQNLTLSERLEAMLASYPGEWSIYYKDLEGEDSFSLNSVPMNSASVIKLFVMAKTYEDMDLVLANEAAEMKEEPDSAAVSEKVDKLLRDMIVISDNESFNELVRLQSETHDFLDGAERINEYLEEHGYTDTTVAHTLAPSVSAPQGEEDAVNETSVLDCGRLLERIFLRECVNATASVKMLNLLLDQSTVYKIPEGVPDSVVTASKSGENDTVQNDAAIVFGEQHSYILCVFCNGYEVEGDAITQIQQISSAVYADTQKEQ